MIILNIEQGSREWQLARIGIPTASQFDRVMTPKKLMAAAAGDKYRAELLAEWIVGHPIDFSGKGGSGFTERGTEMEGEARKHYEFNQDVEVQRVGFVLRDDKLVGGSPDGLVNDDGGADFKCPAIQTHISYLLDSDLLVDEYRSQAQGYMYLTGRAWWDLFSFNPVLPHVRVRVDRDEKFQTALDGHLYDFTRVLEAAKLQLAAHKQVPPWMFEDEAPALETAGV